MSEHSEIPLFPLNTVLFPGGPLPLRIFEPRYVDMVRRCMREQSAFGVLLIRAGGETGEVASTAEIGTSARIVDFYQLPDRLLGITCIGERRFRVLERRRERDGLNVGSIEWLAPEPAVPVPEEHRHLADLVRRVLPEFGELYQHVPKHFDDAAWVGARLVEMLPISLGDKQQCLELDDPVKRLWRIAPLIRRSED
ncbi:MAG: LON peptidase substrate-binding domain-containing protein [Steroidobacteraceae bacterium]